MGLELDYGDGQTPLDEEEREGLLIPTITTRGELNEFEQQGIEKAIEWTLKRRFNKTQILKESFVKDLHRRMYAQIWVWAGQFRKTNKNLGVDKLQIGIELKKLLDDSVFWIDQNTFEPDEVAIRFKHRIVSIHCFSNGNGRHSRLMADLIIKQIFTKPVFTWGSTNLTKPGGTRADYLKAMRAADAGDYLPLVIFARS